jgi:hypothetical protein
MNPEISVLVATRRRPALLARMAKSLQELAADPSSYEVLLAVDHDDILSLDHWSRLVIADETNWRAIVMKRLGYSGMHEYLNRLAAIAKGRWLFVLGDDAFVKTAGWDALLLAQPCDRLVNTCTVNAMAYSSCALMHFAMPKAWAEAMGRVSPHQQSDTYLTHLGNLTGRIDLRWLFDIVHVDDGAGPSDRIADDVTAEIRYAEGVPQDELKRDAIIIDTLYGERSA